MAHLVTVPRLGWSMEEGTFLGWLKHEGQFVRAGEPLYQLEGDKAVQEIEAIDEGLLCIAPNAPAPETTVLVGQVLACLAEPGETIDWNVLSPSRSQDFAGPLAESGSLRGPVGSASHEIERPPAAESDQALPAGRPSSSQSAGSPPVRRKARVRLQLPPACVEPAREHLQSPPVAQPQIRPQSVSHITNCEDSLAGARRPFATPRARSAAKRNSVDWRTLIGTGTGGRIRERDVLAAISCAPLASANHSAGAPTATPRAGSAQKPNAEALTSEHFNPAKATSTFNLNATSVTLFAHADARNLVRLRRQFRVSGTEAPPLVALVAKIAAACLARQPMFMPHLSNNDSHDSGFEDFAIGLAIDTPRGLLVPVMRRVRAMPVSEVAVLTRQLAERARRGLLTVEETRGAQLTITNLGAFEIDSVTVSLMPAETPLLALGRLYEEPIAARAKNRHVRTRLPLSLAFDRRTIDPAFATYFFRDLARAIALPIPDLLN